MLYNIIIFSAAFMFTLSCIFTVVDKIFNVDEIFKVRKKVILLYLISGSISSIVASSYCIIVNRIF